MFSPTRSCTPWNLHRTPLFTVEHLDAGLVGPKAKHSKIQKKIPRLLRISELMRNSWAWKETLLILGPWDHMGGTCTKTACPRHVTTDPAGTAKIPCPKWVSANVNSSCFTAAVRPTRGVQATTGEGAAAYVQNNTKGKTISTLMLYINIFSTYVCDEGNICNRFPVISNKGVHARTVRVQNPVPWGTLLPRPLAPGCRNRAGATYRLAWPCPTETAPHAPHAPRWEPCVGFSVLAATSKK